MTVHLLGGHKLEISENAYSFDEDLMKSLRPYLTSNIRLGSEFDGGYVIPEVILNKSNLLISYGYGHNADFERDFIRHSADNKVLLYEKNINILNLTLAIFKHIRLKITFQRGFPVYHIYNFVKYLKLKANRRIKYLNYEIVANTKNKKQLSFIETLKDITKNSTIIKMDIEGAEYECLNINSEILSQVNCLIIEFHQIELEKSNFLLIIKNLTKNFSITNLHVNNFALSKSYMPQVIEIVLLNRKFLSLQKIEYVSKIPSPLDSPNNPKSPDLNFIY